MRLSISVKDVREEKQEEQRANTIDTQESRNQQVEEQHKLK